MCWTKKNHPEPKEPETKEETLSAYWVDGKENRYSTSLDWLVRDCYSFGANVYVGKVRRKYVKDDYGWWTQTGVYFSNEQPVPKDVLFSYIKEAFCWIDSMDEFDEITDDSYYYDVFIPRKVVDILRDKYSEAFSLLLAERCKHSKRLVDRALVFYIEGLSPDMRAYLLLSDSQSEDNSDGQSRFFVI